MHIAFNAQRLAEQRLGVGRYIEYMLRYWSGMLTPQERVTAFLRRPLTTASEKYLKLPASIVPRVLPPDVSGIPWENIALRGPASDCDVLFCPAYTAPVGYRRPLVVATHSANDIHPGAHPWWHRFTYDWLIHRSARVADAIIVASESARQDIAHHWGIPAERMTVVLQGADDVFRPMDDPAALRAVRQRYFGGDRPYILFVGKASARRNIPMLLEAYAKVRHEAKIPHGVLLFGPNHLNLPLADISAKLGIVGDVVQTDGKIDDHSELVPIYSGADVFVHPSEYEGWSMTTVEAMACGAAVIAANRGGLGEAANGHAFMLDAPSVDSLADALNKVLSDTALRQDLKRRARARGGALTWHDTTLQTLNVIRAVARN